jgi:hypothetical protein
MTQKNVNASIKFTTPPSKSEEKKPTKRNYSKRRGQQPVQTSPKHEAPQFKFDIKQ